MFTSDLCYISSVNSGAPSGSGANVKSMLELLKKVFAGPVVSYDAINGQEVTINAGVNLNKTTILEINDGEKSIFSRVNILDSNVFSIIEDISELNKGNIVISYPKMSYEIDAEQRILSNNFSKIQYGIDDQNVETIAEHIISGKTVKFNTIFIYNGTEYEIIYNDVFIFIKFRQNESYSPMVLAMQEKLSFCRNNKVSLSGTASSNAWAAVTAIGGAGFSFGDSQIVMNNAPLSLNNFLCIGESVDFLYNFSGGLPEVKDKTIYKDVINNKNFFIFYSSHSYDKGYHVMFGGS